MRIEIDNTQSAVPVDEPLLASIRLAAAQAVAATGFAYDVSLEVVLTDDAGIRSLNREHRGIDKPTDVLSFPMLEFTKPLLPAFTEADTDGEGGLLIGSIVVSLECVGRQAKAYGHGFDRELGFVTVHGMLHLLGFDHDTKEREQEMFGLQEDVLGALGLERR